MTFYYIANIRTGDVVILGNADMYFFAISTITNIYNILLSKFREVQLFTTYSIAVFIPINKIADTGIPAKVINVIVQAVSIVVARFQTWRTWADKCSQYKLMDESENMTIIVEQTNTQITAAFIKGKFFDIRFFFTQFNKVFLCVCLLFHCLYSRRFFFSWRVVVLKKIHPLLESYVK